MLENLNLDDLKAITDTLPGPHSWTHATEDIFVCMACHIAFEFGAEPMPLGPCAPDPDPPKGRVVLDGLDLDEFIRRYGHAAAERRLAEHGMRVALSPLTD